MSALTDFWMSQYKKSRGISYMGFSRRDGVILARLSKVYGEPQLRRIIKRYLSTEDDHLARQSGWDTRVLEYRARGIDYAIAKQYGEEAVREAKEKREDLSAAPAAVLDLVERIGGRK